MMVQAAVAPLILHQEKENRQWSYYSECGSSTSTILVVTDLIHLFILYKQYWLILSANSVIQNCNCSLSAKKQLRRHFKLFQVAILSWTICYLLMTIWILWMADIHLKWKLLPPHLRSAICTYGEHTSAWRSRSVFSSFTIRFVYAIKKLDSNPSRLH